MNAPDSIRTAESPIVTSTVARLAKYVPEENLQVVGDFARIYLRRAQDGPLTKLTPDELAAHVAGLFRFASDRGLNPVSVRAFNPTPESDGYPSAGTVVEVSMEDRPFLIDSVTGEIQSHGPAVEYVVHPVLGTKRNTEGALVAVGPARDADRTESIQHYQLDRLLDPAQLDALHDAVIRTLSDVRKAVDDFAQLKGRIPRMMAFAEKARIAYPDDDVVNATKFLEWLLDLNFVFLGYREYEIVDVDGQTSLRVVPESGLGILRDDGTSAYSDPVPLTDLVPELRARFESGELLVITKANSFSTVHRRVKLDYIGLRTVDDEGRIRGEARMLGIFTSKAYMAPASSVPLLNHKLQQIVEAEDLIEGSHDHKVTKEIFETFPKEELFSAPVSEIHQSVIGLMRLRESQHVRLFIRRDLLNRSVAIVVALPRDRFNAPLRKRLQQLFMDTFNGSSVDYMLALGEVDPAQIHFTVWVRDGEIPEVSFEDLEQEVAVLARTWEDRLTEELISRVGEEEGRRMAATWAASFPEYYQTSVQLQIAAGDVINIDRQDRSGDDLQIGLQNETPDETRDTLTRLTVYRRHDKLSLSAIMPHLNALGLHVVEEIPTRLLDDSSGIFIHDFGVLGPDDRQLDIAADGERIGAAVHAVLERRAESDSLNRLIISAGLDHHQISVLRAYRTYMQRVATTFTANYINDILASGGEAFGASGQSVASASAKPPRICRRRWPPCRVSVTGR